MSEKITQKSRRFIVSGKVQGVFFRASTRKQAKLNSVTGYAKNLPNGCVEVLLQGNSEQVNSIADWLTAGPEFARVEKIIEVDAQVTTQLKDFSVL